MSSTTATFAFCVAATGPDLRLVVRIDHDVIYDDYPGIESSTVTYEFDDSQERNHTLVFEMRGKRPEYTQLNDIGQILQDRYITISDIAFDDIALEHMFTARAQYHHTNNDHTDPVTECFHGIMGCNGRVELQFSTPIYLWLLENM